jgi:hypothetical protein
VIRRLLPEGTKLCDAPPDWRGLTWREYEYLMSTIRTPARVESPEPEISRKPVSTQLDLPDKWSLLG